MSAIEEVLSKSSIGAIELSSRPSRGLAILTCMDARIDVLRMLGLKPGDAHVLRNAGGIVTDDVLRSLLLSQRLLKTREVMIIQHTGCGLLGLNDDELKKEIRAETGVHIPFDLGGFSDVRGAVARSIDRIRTSPLLLHRDVVRGFIYDLESGHLSEIETAD